MIMTKRMLATELRASVVSGSGCACDVETF